MSQRDVHLGHFLNRGVTVLATGGHPKQHLFAIDHDPTEVVNESVPKTLSVLI